MRAENLKIPTFMDKLLMRCHVTSIIQQTTLDLSTSAEKKSEELKEIVKLFVKEYPEDTADR